MYFSPAVQLRVDIWAAGFMIYCPHHFWLCTSHNQRYVFLLSWLLRSSTAKTQSIFQWWHHPHEPHHHHHHPRSSVYPQIWALSYWCLLVASLAPRVSIKSWILYARLNWSQRFINWINLWMNENLMRSRGLSMSARRRCLVRSATTGGTKAGFFPNLKMSLSSTWTTNFKYHIFFLLLFTFSH